MNINSLLKSINVEKAMEGVEYGTGTFGNIMFRVLQDKIYPLVNNADEIIGIGYETGKVGAEDSIEQMKFERAYCGKPVQEWVNKALQIKYSGKAVDEVREDADCIKVVYKDGSEEIIFERDERYESVSRDENDELPTEEEISFEELFTLRNGYPVNDIHDEARVRCLVKRYLKDAYGHYLSGDCESQFEYEVDEDENCVHVYNIQWGRKV